MYLGQQELLSASLLTGNKARSCVQGDFLSPTEECSTAVLRIQSSDKVTSIGLPTAPAYHVIEFELEVLSLPSAPATGGDTSIPGTPELHRKQKDSQRTGHCMVTTDHKVEREGLGLCG